MVPNMLLIRLMQECLKEEDCVRRVRSRAWSRAAGAGELQGGGLQGGRLCFQMKEGGVVRATCLCPGAEMTCREGCRSEAQQRSDCARGFHLGWRKNKEAPGELSGPCRDELDHRTRS